MNLNLFNKIYMAKSSMTREEELECLEKCGPTLQEEISKFLDDVLYDDIDDNTSVIVLNSYQYDKFRNYCDLSGINYKIEDVTSKVIFGELEFDDVVKEFVINPYLSENLTTDIVLDKISAKGIDSLTDLDKEVLSKSN